MGKLDSLFGANDSTARTNLGYREDGHTMATDIDEVDPQFKDTSRDRSAKIIGVDRIISKEQVRKHFDDEKISELAHSLETLGQQQPVSVYWSDEDDRYVIKQGECRFRAACLAGLTTLKCQVGPKPTEEILLEEQYAENAMRSDLNPIEEGLAFKKLKELKGCSANQLAQRIGKNQTTVSMFLRFLDLPQNIQDKIASGEIPKSIAKQISKLKTEDEQHEMATRYLAGELTTGAAQAETTTKAKATTRTPQKNTKKWAVNGVAISVAYPRAGTLADVAAALEVKARELREDGRTTPRVAA